MMHYLHHLIFDPLSLWESLCAFLQFSPLLVLIFFVFAYWPRRID
jgi:hypothetical protein